MKYLLKGTYCFSSVILALSLAWFALAAVNFHYGFWHDNTGIKAAIDQYGAMNQNRQGFELTTKAQREHLFAQILLAVRNSGKGLETITFEVPQHPKQTLLVEAEVIHLKDVAQLINTSQWLVVPAALVWLGIVVYWQRTRTPLIPPAAQALALAAGCGLAGLLLVLCGPVRVFNQLHIWAFPDNHQWFFYYQQSLMSTLMHAPELFGWIALEWAAVGLLCYMGVQLLVFRVLKGRNKSA